MAAASLPGDYWLPCHAYIFPSEPVNEAAQHRKREEKDLKAHAPLVLLFFFFLFHMSKEGNQIWLFFFLF